MFLEKLRNRGASDSNKYEEEHTVKKYGVNELRQMFLDFFESKGHLVMNSFSLVPQNDNSPSADQCRYGTIKTVFYRSRDSAENPCGYLPEMYPYR